MTKMRVYYKQRSGEVVEIESRPDEDYGDHNLALADEGVGAVVVDSDQLGEASTADLTVKDGEVRRKRRRAGAAHAAEPGADRAREILAMDKSELSDRQWISLYREYLTITGKF